MSTMTCVRLTSLTAAIHIWVQSRGVFNHTASTPVDAEPSFIGALSCHEGELFAYQDKHNYALDMSCGEGNNNDHAEEEEEEASKGDQPKAEAARNISALQSAQIRPSRSSPAPKPRRPAGVPFGVIRRPPFTPLDLRAANQGGRAANPSPAARQPDEELTPMQAIPVHGAGKSTTLKTEREVKAEEHIRRAEAVLAKVQRVRDQAEATKEAERMLREGEQRKEEQKARKTQAEEQKKRNSCWDRDHQSTRSRNSAGDAETFGMTQQSTQQMQADYAASTKKGLNLAAVAG
eukprot:3971214-Amphidinium_carterae.1